MSGEIERLTKITESLLAPPFEWLLVPGGKVVLEDARLTGGTQGGEYWVADFTISKYLVTNAQYLKFLQAADGFSNPSWWEYSPQAAQYRKDRRTPKPTAFQGADLPRTRVSWFESVAFCCWLCLSLCSSRYYCC